MKIPVLIENGKAWKAWPEAWRQHESTSPIAFGNPSGIARRKAGRRREESGGGAGRGGERQGLPGLLGSWVLGSRGV